MDDNPQGLVQSFNSIFGGALTTLAGAFIGRAMWHSGEVKAKRRRLLGWELLWEIPIAIGMAIIGEGLGSWLGLGPPASTAVVAVLSYLGPRGAEALLEKWIAARLTGGK